MTKGEIQQLLQKSFRSHPPPAEANLVPEAGDAQTKTTIRDLFAGRRWYELDADLVIEHAGLIWLMAPPAQRYYIPAFLLATFHAPTDWVYTSNLILNLFLPLRKDDDPARDHFVKFLDALTPTEKSAIRSFLDYTAEKHPGAGERSAAKLALRVLWRKFEPTPSGRDQQTA